MAQDTLVEKWNTLFPRGNPDAYRDRTSQSSDPVSNPLSDVSGLDGEWSSHKKFPEGRKSIAIAVLWNEFCNPTQDAGDFSPTNQFATGFGADTSGGHDQKFKSKAVAMLKNVTVRANDDGAATGQKAFDSAEKGSKFNSFFAAMDDPVIALNATVKNNYRLGSANPDGAFSSYTGRPMTNGGDDIITLTLQQWRDGMA